MKKSFIFLILGIFILMSFTFISAEEPQENNQCENRGDNSFFCSLEEGNIVVFEDEHYYKIISIDSENVQMNIDWDGGTVSILSLTEGESYSVSEFKDGEYEYVIEIDKIFNNVVDFRVKSVEVGDLDVGFFRKIINWFGRLFG